MYDKLIDLGRPLTNQDIVDDSTSPIRSEDSGKVYCYECQGPHKGSISGLTALTTSTGVFTNGIHCGMDSAVYVCLEHTPSDTAFGAFSEDVRATLIEKKHALSISDLAT